MHYCEELVLDMMRVLLDFLSAEKFCSAAENCVRPFLTKGVPSLFSDLSPLYDHPGKADILEQLILELEHAIKTTGAYPGSTQESYLRQGDLGQALKKFLPVEKHYADFTEDQFDFHSYCLRKMTLRTYVDMLKFQDRLHSFSYFRKAATGAISGSKAVDILQAYKGTLKDDYPPDNEHCGHGEMLLYKVALAENTDFLFTKDGDQLNNLHDMQCLSGSKAIDILQAYEETLEDDYPPDNEHCEHGERLLYKISLLEECGLIERALEELHKKEFIMVDKLSYKEQEVSLLEKLGHLSRYDEGLQRCMGLYLVNGQYSSDEIDRLESLYASLSKQYSRSSAVKVALVEKTDFLFTKDGDQHNNLHDMQCMRVDKEPPSTLLWTLNKEPPSTLMSVAARGLDAMEFSDIFAGLDDTEFCDIFAGEIPRVYNCKLALIWPCSSWWRHMSYLPNHLCIHGLWFYNGYIVHFSSDKIALPDMIELEEVFDENIMALLNFWPNFKNPQNADLCFELICAQWKKHARPYGIRSRIYVKYALALRSALHDSLGIDVGTELEIQDAAYQAKEQLKNMIFYLVKILVLMPIPRSNLS